jgi:hypothetical protein
MHHKDYSKHSTREPYFAFIPQIARWAFGIVSGEAQLVEKAVVNSPSWTRQYMGDTYHYYRENPRILYNEVISGFTVAIMQVPESIAFSFVAGVPPLSGLQATFWMATITGVFGGKPGMISGAAGALAVVVDELTLDDGVLSYLPSIEQRCKSNKQILAGCEATNTSHLSPYDSECLVYDHVCLRSHADWILYLSLGQTCSFDSRNRHDWIHEWIGHHYIYGTTSCLPKVRSGKYRLFCPM